MLFREQCGRNIRLLVFCRFDERRKLRDGGRILRRRSFMDYNHEGVRWFEGWVGESGVGCGGSLFHL